MEFSCRCHLTTGGITSSTLLPFGLWAPGCADLGRINPGDFAKARLPE